MNTYTAGSEFGNDLVSSSAQECSLVLFENQKDKICFKEASYKRKHCHISCEALVYMCT